MTTHRIVDQLRLQRQTNGLTLRELQAASGIWFSVLSDYENGRRSPGLASLDRWASALGLNVELMPVDPA